MLRPMLALALLLTTAAPARAADRLVDRGDSAHDADLLVTVRRDRVYRGDTSSCGQLLATGPGCMLAEHAGAAALF